MGHGYQVPVDKHDSDETFSPPPDPLVGVKGRIFKFRYNSVRCQYFYGNFAFRQRYKKYETYQTWFSMEGLCLYPRDLGMGSKVQNSTFSEHGHVAYQIIENHECRNMVPNILLADTLTLGMGQIGQNLPFSEHGHIEYQFKGNQKMQQQGSKYLPRDAYPLALTLGMGLEGQIHVAYQN